MVSILHLGKDDGGNVDFSIELVSDNQQITLTAATEATLTIPSTATIAVMTIAGGNAFFVAESSTPITLPTASFTSSEAGMIVNGGVRRNLTPGNTLRFIGRVAADLSVTFFKRN